MDGWRDFNLMSTLWPSPAQVRVCIAQEIAPAVPLFNHGVVLDVPATVGDARLRSAVIGAIAAHQALRGRLRPGGDVGWTVEDGPPAGPSENLVELDPDDLAALADLHLARPFDLNDDPPVRVGWWTAERATRVQLAFHHVATDARTLDLLLADIAERYATGEGRSTCYYDLVAAHWLRGPDDDRRMDDYAFDVADLDLSPLFPGTRRPGSRPVEHALPVPDEVTRRVTELARGLGVTNFSVWLTAWTRALSHLLDRTSYPMLVPVSTRRTQAELDAVGFFVSSVVVPVRHDPDEELARALARTSDSVLTALSRRDLPLHQLARHLDLDHRGQDNPLTQASAQALTGLPESIPTPDGDVRVTLVDSPVARYQLSFDVQGSSGGGVLRLRADPGLVEHARLTALADLVFDQLMPPAPVRRSARAEAPPNGRRRHSAPPVAGPSALVEGLRGRLAAAPLAPAVEWDGGRWTNDDLLRAVDQVMASLEAAGCESGDPVLFDLPRGPGLVAALVGALKADLVPVFTRPGFPESVRRDIQRLTACTVALSGGPADVNVEALESAAETRVPPGTAYVTFTSGSSGGVPKGVPTPTSGALAYLTWVCDEISLTPGDRCLQLARPGFDSLARDVLAPLQAGTVLVIASERARQHGEALRTAIEDHDISVVPAMVPTQLRRLIHATRLAGPLTRLRALCVAGEPLMHDDVAELSALAPNCRLLNLYGPTETTMTTTVWEARPAADGPARLPVGAPIPGTAVHVVDDRGAVQPPGGLGRVIVTGGGVAPGYLHWEGEGSATFGWWEFDGGPVPGFATDDLGYWLDEGGLRVQGRVGTERKLHGERFDLVAVESALTSHPAVADAVVGISGEGSLAMLVANVVWATGSDEAGVRQHLLERLPPIAVPRQLVGVDAVPRLANGKVDRSQGIIGPPRDRAAPTTDAEAHAAAVVARVLGRRAIDPNASLFDLGCDSLDLIEIAEAAFIRSGPSDRIGELFDDPTVTTIARLLASPAGSSDDGPWSGLLSPLGPRTAPRGARLVAFPPAGSDAPVFQPLVAPLAGIAAIDVVRRPSADRREGTAAAWLEDHARQAAGELLAEHGDRPLVLCGYSVGFVVACLVASALNERGVRPTFLVGLNPTVPGAEPSVGQDLDSPQTEPILAERWRHDLCLRGVVPRRLPEVEATLLFLGDEDRRRWASAGQAAMAALPHVDVRHLQGPHTINDEVMTRIGYVLGDLLTRRAQ